LSTHDERRQRHATELPIRIKVSLIARDGSRAAAAEDERMGSPPKGGLAIGPSEDFACRALRRDGIMPGRRPLDPRSVLTCEHLFEVLPAVRADRSLAGRLMSEANPLSLEHLFGTLAASSGLGDSMIDGHACRRLIRRGRRRRARSMRLIMGTATPVAAFRLTSATRTGVAGPLQ
jgi:hypothetical protein